MDLYREGFLNKAGKGVLQTHLHSWRPRYFVLDGSCLKYYKTKEIEPENMLGCIKLIDITCVSLMKNEKYGFQITTKSRSYYMSGRSDDEVCGWVNVLEMAKAKMVKRDAENTSHDDYDEVKALPKNNKKTKVVPSEYSMVSGVGGTGKPPPKPIPSEYMLVGSLPPTKTKNGDNVSLPSNGKSEAPKRTSVKTVESSEMMPAADSTGCDEDESLLEDPTYETVHTNQSEAPKRTSVKTVESSEMMLAADSTGCDDDDDESLLEDPTYETVHTSQSEAPKRTSVENVDVAYDDPNSSERDTADLYDTVLDGKTGKVPVVELPPPLPMRPSSLSEQPNDNELTVPGVQVYDKILIPRGESSQGGNEKNAKDEGAGGTEEKKTTLPVYAKPIRKPKSLKRTVNPAMMDIGEVSNDVEKESSGGMEILKMGMTQPIGDRFACEELKELLNKLNEEDNNNDDDDDVSEQSEAKMADFDVEEGGLSAFEVLKRFLETHQ